MEGIFREPAQPGVYIFASQDQHTMDLIMNQIIKVTTDCFNSTSKPIQVTSSSLSSSRYMSDHTKIIEDFKPKLETSGILVVHDLNKVSTKVVPGFHSICDTINPLVRKSIIFFTMIIPSIPNKSNGK